MAWHLCGFGSDPLLVSAVGADAEGREALDGIETADGATIIFDWRGFARPYPPERRQIVVAGTHVCGDERYAWLNDVVCVGTGEIRPRDESGGPRAVVGGAIDFVIDFAELIWEPIP